MAIIPEGQKILTSAPEVNTTYGGSASLKALNTWYTMQDIANTVQPYKVFTALLTQGGGDNEQHVYVGTPTVIGVTYNITANDDGLADFTNIGTPDNNVGTKFIATGIAPASWGTYAELTYNMGAPVATVLENTIGNIWFTYYNTGTYEVNSDGLFTENKSFFLGGSTFYSISEDSIFSSGFNFNSLTTSSIFINTVQTNADTKYDDVLYKTSIEIRVYN
jgi:hypothetical protein